MNSVPRKHPNTESNLTNRVSNDNPETHGKKKSHIKKHPGMGEDEQPTPQDVWSSEKGT